MIRGQSVSCHESGGSPPAIGLEWLKRGWSRVAVSFHRDGSQSAMGRAGGGSQPAAWRRIVAWAVGCVLVAAVILGTAGLWRLSRRFPLAPFAQTSRLYGRSPELAVGAACDLVELSERLAAQGYVGVGAAGSGAAAAGDEARPAPGTFQRRGETLAIGVRRFPTPAGWGGGQPLRVEVRQGRIVRLLAAGRPVGRAAIEPPLLASFYGKAVEERWPVRLDAMPAHVVRAVLAAEDDRFFQHSGLSASAIVRAAWVDLRGGELRQGGSTITQQLVKVLYLSRRRNLLRKTKEAALAELVELRHGKRTILEAYLNSIYWGRSGPANLIGLGAAARAYFGRLPEDLDLAQAATLAAMIRAPADYAPATHGQALIERRNRVLGRLAALGWASPAAVRQAQAAPLDAAPRPLEPRPCAPYFADLAAQEARRRFGVQDLEDGGYQLFSTLDAHDQRQAEAALAGQLTALDERSERGGGRRERERERQAEAGRRELQAALVSVDPRDGAILAYVGGRDYKRSQFDRLAQARRPLGSAFKPVIYAAAFDYGAATPATLLQDAPVLVRTGGATWEPQNFDRTFRGWVTARAALEQSLNVPTVRLALAVGLRRISGLAQALGLAGAPPVVPALALGAVEATPLEAARVYSTFATLGVRPSLHALDAVRDRYGIDLADQEPPQQQRVLAATTGYLVTSLLQGVVDHGTGGAVRRLGLADPLAGKTGTTSELRDSWFAGYSAERVTVVWVGYDDDSETRFSGATAAVPLWSRFMLAVRPPGGFAGFTPPPGLVMVTVDPTTGQLAGPGCPQRVTELMPERQAPIEPCQRHLPAELGGAAGAVGFGGTADGAAGDAGSGWTAGGVAGSPPVDGIAPARSGGLILIRRSLRPPAADAEAAAEPPSGDGGPERQR
jgi:penicillin-binding protein 1B